MIVTVREAKARLSRLLDEVAAGEEVIITCDGRPKARLTKVAPAGAALRIDWARLRAPRRKGQATPAERLVRAERDARD